MPCWVVPTIAAEIWGVSVDHLLQRVRDGNLAYRVDEGFMFVDVQPPPQPKVENPPTFTVLSQAEVEALRDAEDEVEASQHDDETRCELAGDDDEDDADEQSQSPDDDEASIELGDWRTARQRVGMTRHPAQLLAKPPFGSEPQGRRQAA